MCQESPKNLPRTTDKLHPMLTHRRSFRSFPRRQLKEDELFSGYPYAVVCVRHIYSLFRSVCACLFSEGNHTVYFSSLFQTFSPTRPAGLTVDPRLRAQADRNRLYCSYRSPINSDNIPFSHKLRQHATFHLYRHSFLLVIIKKKFPLDSLQKKEGREYKKKQAKTKTTTQKKQQTV